MDITPCLRCGKPVKPRSDRVPQYCSITCSNKSRTKRVEKPCGHCGQPFMPPQNHASQKFCSVTCRDEAKTTLVATECCQCSQPTTQKKSRMDRFGKSFCSFKCYGEWRKTNSPSGPDHVQYKPRTTASCKQCGKAVKRLACQIRGQVFCSSPCLNAWQRESGYSSGPNNANWLGGHSDYRGPNWNQQRKKALARDGHRCQNCGITKNLQVHHRKPYRDFADYKEANHIDNLRTLCSKCHLREEWTTGSLSKSAPSSSRTSQPALSVPG